MSRAFFLVIPLLLLGACERFAGLEPPIDGRVLGSGKDSGGRGAGGQDGGGGKDSGGQGAGGQDGSGRCGPPPDLNAGKDDCAEGYANCGASGGCAIDLTSDVNNCGYCGHVCHGAPCDASTCGAVTIADEPDVSGIAIGGSKIFWAAFGGIARVSSAVIATRKRSAEWSLDVAAFSLAVDDTYVYWTYQYQRCISRALLDGGAATDLGICHGSGEGKLALDRDDVYWVISNTSGLSCFSGDPCCPRKNQSCIMKVNKAQNITTPLAKSQGLSTAIAVDSEYFYWGDFFEDTGVINRCLKTAGCDDGNGIQTFATNAGSASEIVVDEANQYVYWIDGSAGRVYRHTRASDGGKTEPILSTANADLGRSLTIDDAFVYWPQTYGGPHPSIARALKKSGQDQNAFADMVFTSADQVASDCENIYWSGIDGGVFMVSK